MNDNNLRDNIKDKLKKSMIDKNERCVATLRLILAAIKDRDIAARADDNQNGIDNDAILKLLQTMIKQRRESIVLYEKAKRQELVDQEKEEITIIESFLPEQMDDSQIEKVVHQSLKEINAANLRDMGKLMSYLHEHYAGKMDFGKASAIAKQNLAS